MSKYTLGDYDYEMPGSGRDALAWELGRLKEELERYKILCARAADALEAAPIEHAQGCPVSGICVCELGKERVSICDELRKAV